MIQFRQWRVGAGVGLTVAAAIVAFAGCGGNSGTSIFSGGGGSGGTGNANLTGQLTAENVQTNLDDMDAIYGAKSFEDAVFAFQEVTNPAQAAANSKAKTSGTENDTSGTCPVITDNVTTSNDSPNPYVATARFSNCVPQDFTEKATGSLTTSSLGSGSDKNGDFTDFVTDFHFTNLNLDGDLMNGEVKVTEHGSFDTKGVFTDTTETYQFINFKLNDDTYNGTQAYSYSDANAINGQAVVNMSVSYPGDTVSTKMNLTFKAERSGRTINAVINGPVALTSKATGTYNLQFNNTHAQDACDSANSGTITMTGKNGKADITFGPACGQGHISINGATATTFSGLDRATRKQLGHRFSVRRLSAGVAH